MSHSDSLKNVPYVDSKEFEKFLEDNGFDKKIFNEVTTNKLGGNPNDSLKNDPKPDQSKKEFISKIVNNWCIKNPGPSLAIVLGGSAFICYKIIVGIISQAVFKGNLKTSRYFDKHSS